MIEIVHANMEQAEKLAKLQKKKACTTLEFRASRSERESKRRDLESQLSADDFVYAINEKRGPFESHFSAVIWFRKRKDAYRVQDLFVRFSPIGHVGRTEEINKRESWIDSQRQY